MLRDRKFHAVFFAALLVASSATLGGVAFGQLTESGSNSLQTGTAAAITANDSTDGDGNWSQPRANAGRTGATNDDGPMPYGNVSWENDQPVSIPGIIVVGDTVIASHRPGSVADDSIVGANASTGEWKWNRSDLGSPTGPPTEMNGTVYVSFVDDDYVDNRNARGLNGLYAFEPATGATEWWLNDTLSAPVAADGRIFVSEIGETAEPDTYDNVTAVDATMGQRLWTSDVQGKPLAYADGRLIVGNETENTLSAVDATDGTLLWRTDVGQEPTLDEEVVATTDGVYVTDQRPHRPPQSQTERLLKFDATDGAMEWQTNLTTHMVRDNDDFDAVLAPAVANGTVYVVTSSGRSIRFYGHGTVHALDTDTGEYEWHWQTMSKLLGAPAVANGTVYTLGIYEFDESQVGNRSESEQGQYREGRFGTAYALDATNGTERWNLRIDFARPAIRDTTVDDGRLFFVHGVNYEELGAITSTDVRPPWYDHPIGDQDFDFSPPNRRPEAFIDVKPPDDGQWYPPNTTVRLNGSESFEPFGGNISTYEWDLDDDGQYEATGETTTVQTSSVPCDVIQVTLRVTDDDGETDTETVIFQTEP